MAGTLDEKYIQAGFLVNHEAELAPRAGEWLHPKTRLYK